MNYRYVSLLLLCTTTLSASSDGLPPLLTTQPISQQDSQRETSFDSSDSTKKTESTLFKHFQKHQITYGIAAGTTIAVATIAGLYYLKKSFPQPQQPFCNTLEA